MEANGTFQKKMPMKVLVIEPFIMQIALQVVMQLEDDRQTEKQSHPIGLKWAPCPCPFPQITGSCMLTVMDPQQTISARVLLGIDL